MAKTEQDKLIETIADWNYQAEVTLAVPSSTDIDRLRGLIAAIRAEVLSSHMVDALTDKIERQRFEDQLADARKTLQRYRQTFTLFFKVNEKPAEEYIADAERIIIMPHKTIKPNARDHGRKGQPRARLTEEQVREIRQLAEDDSITYSAIADTFGISVNYVYRLVNNLCRTDVK